MMVLGDILTIGKVTIGVIAEVMVTGASHGSGLVVSGQKVPRFLLLKKAGDCQVFEPDGAEIRGVIAPEVADLIDEFSSSFK